MVLFEGSEQHSLLNYFLIRCIPFNNWKIALLFLIIHHISCKKMIYPTHFHVTCSPFIGEAHTSSLINIRFTNVICFGQAETEAWEPLHGSAIALFTRCHNNECPKWMLLLHPVQPGSWNEHTLSTEPQLTHSMSEK